MKKFTSLLCLALFAMVFIVGCGEKSPEDKAADAAAEAAAAAKKAAAALTE